MATFTTQGDLDKLRGADGRSRQLSKAWRDTAEYKRQKGEMERKSWCWSRSQPRSHKSVQSGSKYGAQAEESQQAEGRES